MMVYARWAEGEKHGNWYPMGDPCGITEAAQLYAEQFDWLGEVHVTLAGSEVYYCLQVAKETKYRVFCPREDDDGETRTDESCPTHTRW